MKKISIGILTYNHAHFIEQCLASVMSLNYDNLEIIISDDCSQDNTFDIIKRVVQDIETTHTIVLNRNDINLGLAENFNKTFGVLATGEYFVTLGGDDAIKNDYFENVSDVFVKDSSLMMVDVSGEIIDEHGRHVQNIALSYDRNVMSVWDYINLKSVHTFAPGRMFRRSLVDDFDKINSDCPTEDRVLVNRALLLGKIARLNKDVVLYRRHQDSITSSANFKTINHRKIIEQFQKDCLTAFNLGLISYEMMSLLKKRYKLDLAVRMAGKKNKIVGRFTRFLLVLKYKIYLLTL